MIQSRTTRQFWRLFYNLSPDAQRDAKRAYRIFQTNPAHPGLHFKKLEGEDDIYSARIGLDYRALAVVIGDRVVWYWIGSHSLPEFIGMAGPRRTLLRRHFHYQPLLAGLGETGGRASRFTRRSSGNRQPALRNAPRTS